MNSNLTFDKDTNKCVLTPIKNNNEGIQNAIDKESQKQVQACTDSGGTWDDKKKSPCSCSKQKGLTDDIKGFTCKCSQNGYIFQNGKCTKQTSSSNTTNSNQNNIMTLCTTKYKGKYDSVKNECTCPATDDGKCEQWKQSLKPDMDAVKCFASGGRMIGNSCIKTK